MALKSISATVVGSGNYTPTLTNTTNISSSTAFSCRHTRNGDVAMVSGRVQITPTASGLCVLGFSLPIASNLAAVGDLSGTACTRATSLAGGIAADAANDRASFGIVAPSTTALDLVFVFTYTII